MKVGDKVVCVYEDISIDGIIFGLTKNKVYDLIYVDIRYSEGKANIEHNRVMVKNDSGINSWYFSERFKTIKELRKLKLEKIENVQS